VDRDGGALSAHPTGPSVSAVVLAYGGEPWLEACVDAILGSDGLRSVELILVDNGCTDGSIARVEGRPGVVVLRPERNLGFAGGCNLAAAQAGGDVIAFVNSDAVVAPDALRHLAVAALESAIGITTGSIRLAHAPDRLNSGGNEIHFLGLGWAGHLGEAASQHRERRKVTAASGAGMAMARATWERMGGFEERYFAYHEDAELSIRCWQQGLSVVFVPEAVVLHHYEFSRNPDKLYLLERNRLVFLATVYEARTLLALAPLLVVFEAAVFVLAIAGGWGGRKIDGWRWLLRHRRWLWERRRQLQSVRSGRPLPRSSGMPWPTSPVMSSSSTTGPPTPRPRTPGTPAPPS
jgi:GT2 family glycosyltransferase